MYKEDAGRWVRTVDDDLGAGFDLSLIDLNNDGRLDILATNHENDERAGVFAYEIPTRRYRMLGQNIF